MSVTDEIKARIDIVEFVSRTVPLKRSGRTYKACCPFHQERTPSFVVFPETGTWRCFGACGVGGDVFSFLMQKENLSFPEALRQLATETGVELEDREQSEDAQERELLYEVNAQAALYYRNLLHRHPAAEAARAYLQRRGIHAQTAEMFQLGFALDSWDALLVHLMEQGYTPELQHRAGLLKYNEERDSYYDAFRRRVMIPISDRQGRVIGFGGRILDDSVPKYLNTAETPVFHKSAVVYGLDRAHRAIRRADQVVIVEGYMDVIAAHQYGFDHVVACLGTALTEEQLRQLHRYTDNFVLALDADTAGQQATIRGLNQARQALQRKPKPVITPTGRIRLETRLGANLRISALPEGRDPDDILRQDPDLWRDLVNRAQPLADYYFGIVAEQYDLGSARGKGEAVAELAPLIAELSDEIERQHYVQQLSRLVQIDEQTIEHRVQAAAKVFLRPTRGQRPRRRFTRNRQGPDTHKPDTPEAPAHQVGQETATVATETADGDRSTESPAPSRLTRVERKLEKFLLAHLLYEPNLLVWLADMAERLEFRPLHADDLQDIEHREIFLALKRFIDGNEIWDPETFQGTLSPNLHATLAGLALHVAELPDRDLSEIREAVLKVMIRMRRERLRDHLNAMQFLLHDAQRSHDREAIIGYSAAINANRRERHHLERVLADINRVLYGVPHLEQGVCIA